MKTPTIHLCLAIAVLLAVCATPTPSHAELTDEGRLPPCGAAPNCVSSDATGNRSIEPLALGKDPRVAWQGLIAHLEGDPSYEIRVQEADYLRAEARTRLLRFVDDVEFHLRPATGEIAMRSASRVGFSDWGKNRRRLEAVRQALRDAGVLETGE